MIAIGIMSGTSGDGADAAAIELDVPAKDVRVLATASAPFPKRVRDAVLALGEGGMADAREIARLHGLLGDEYAALAQGVATKLGRKPDVIAIHGQTIAHLPEENVTFQIGDAATSGKTSGPFLNPNRTGEVRAEVEGLIADAREQWDRWKKEQDGGARREAKRMVGDALLIWPDYPAAKKLLAEMA